MTPQPGVPGGAGAAGGGLIHDVVQEMAPGMSPTAQLGLEVGSRLMGDQMGYVNENVRAL